MDLLVEVAFNLVRAFLISCLFKQVLTAREDGRLKRMIGVLCVGLWSFGVYVLGAGSVINGLLSAAAYILFAVLCFEGSTSDKIISGFTGMVVLMVSSRLAFDIIAPMMFSDSMMEAVTGVRRYSMLGVSLMICLGLIILLGHAGKSTLSPVSYTHLEAGQRGGDQFRQQREVN